ncbi:Kyphoscoliosis peptidase [Hyphodiscus hymeniophilus]|uniref:Kyphoscoliosis peptidase n=1 Tax=Hyphodiscus hymeniophilus TaxID=353542 RepID=A0A9P7AXK4_9HELO|nr:Kyphoscoliosis peptidase [Hyphodiscus hymeniophilus]
MTEIEEPQFTSLQARIAALNQAKSTQHQTFGKRAPAPLPPTTPASRPAIPSRTQTTNNPPLVTYGSSVTKQANNQPIGIRGNLLPPPPVDRDNPNNGTAKTPLLPARNAPPPLPGRKASAPSPALPPRKSSTQLARRGSNESTMSFSSTVSGTSLSQAGSSTTSASSVESRKLPPPLHDTKLPPLPPSKKEVEEKAKFNKVPLVTAKSAPNMKEPPAVERSLTPKMPSRPGGPPRLPSRPASRNNLAEEGRPQLPQRTKTVEQVSPTQPPRKLPPSSAATRSILTMGFNNKTETPNPAPRPAPSSHTKPTGPAVQELTDRNFDSVVMTGKSAFVKFYSPRCWNCQQLDPIWKQLAEDFAFASDKLVIAQLDIFNYKSFHNRFGITRYPGIMFFDGENEAPEQYPRTGEAPGPNELEDMTEFLEARIGLSVTNGGSSAKAKTPPPIPLSSKPTFAQVKAVQFRPHKTTPVSGCLICRDFSGPDQVASQYPRQFLPRSGDMTGYLADVLCAPFNSATDKARAIFTWLHHNIAYDTAAFFSKNVKHVDPKDTITTGLAVCGGYAGLYVAVALKAGLESVMVTGHGKGYGYSPLKPGERPPPCNPAGHAWNAVRIDGGEWKLLDACWGAGNVGNQVYNKKFTQSWFTMSNDDFGIKHFPADDAYFFRSDGRSQTWEDYMIGPIGAEGLQLFGAVEDHGLSQTSFSPPQKRIPINSGEVIRFQFSKACEHWDHENNGQGKPYCMILKINGVDGRKEDFVAFENNDFWYWADVPAKDLGAPGQGVSVFAVTSVNGEDARGLSRRDYLSKKGRCGMGFGGVAAWELV